MSDPATLQFPDCRRGVLCAVAACLIAGSVIRRADADGELAQYVAKPDASYSWREVGSGHLGGADYVQVILTSQTWRDIPWKHQLIVFRPAKIDAASRQALLFIDGGRWKPEYESTEPGDLPREAQVFTRLAAAIRAPVAVVRQVPYQPLFDRREDALIAYTFDSYLKSGEADWPLLLPMVKSAARAMDAVQEIARQRWQIPVERFTITGASKRGWTSWLTAAVDPRVASVAPMVIDMLNMRAQIELQRATFGELSEEIRDYEDIDLPGRIDSDLGRKLIAMVDPYSYRANLGQPKLILLGTNDRYWPLDALKLYWNDLPRAEARAVHAEPGPRPAGRRSPGRGPERAVSLFRSRPGVTGTRLVLQSPRFELPRAGCGARSKAASAPCLEREQLDPRFSGSPLVAGALRALANRLYVP